MPHPLTRRAFLAGAAALAASRAAGAPPSHLFIVLGTQTGSNLEAVGRAFADAARSTFPDVQLDVSDADGGRLALKSCLSAPGRSDLLCFVNGSMVYSLLQPNDEIGTAFASLTLIGSLGHDRRGLFVATKTGIQSFDELRSLSQPLIVPTATVNAGSHVETLLIAGLTGARLKPVPGYSYAERKLSLLSGEATASVGAIDTVRDLVDQGVLRPVLRLNDAGPDAPDHELPLLSSVAKAAGGPAVSAVIAAVAQSNNLVVAPPGLSHSDIEALGAFFEGAASALQSLPPSTYGKAEIVPDGRTALLERFSTLLTDRDAAISAFAEAIKCGQAIAAGGGCPAG